MPDPFLFALKVADEARWDAMIGDLAACVLEQVGYAPPAIADILTALREALEQGATRGGGERDIRFRAEAGHFHITVSDSGGRQWRVARALPD